MIQLHPYLTFNGNCRDAMLFYRECLGGKISLQTVGESPLSEQLPENMKDFILQAILISDDFQLIGSDMTGETGLIGGNSVSILLNAKSETLAWEVYQKLSIGGTATHPLAEMLQGGFFGDLTDKFGHQWLIHCNQ